MRVANHDLTEAPRFRRRGKELSELMLAPMQVPKPRREPFCAFCAYPLGFVRYKATNGRYVHHGCYGLHEAWLTAGKILTEGTPMRFFLDAKKHEYIVQCNGCPAEKRLKCSQPEIVPKVYADGWEQFGDKLLCAACVMAVRRKLYRAIRVS